MSLLKPKPSYEGPTLKELFEKAAELRRNHVPIQDPQTILKNLGGYTLPESPKPAVEMRQVVMDEAEFEEWQARQKKGFDILDQFARLYLEISRTCAKYGRQAPKGVTVFVEESLKELQALRAASKPIELAPIGNAPLPSGMFGWIVQTDGGGMEFYNNHSHLHPEGVLTFWHDNDCIYPACTRASNDCRTAVRCWPIQPPNPA